MNTYLDLVRLGKNEWWRFLLAIAVILFFWQILGAIPYGFLLVWVMADGNPATSVTTSGQFSGVNPIISFVALMLASIAFMIGMYLAVRLIHRRPFLSLITPASAIAWRRFFQGFGTWFTLSALMAIIEAVTHPGRYLWTLDIGNFIPLLILAVILIPIQTSAEELFFRGYLLQGVGLLSRNKWFLSALSGFLFMLPHFLNPEAKTNYVLLGLYYFSIGAVMAYISLRDGRLELALGLHAANNLFTALFANSTVTVMPTPSLFTVDVLDAPYSVTAALIGLAIFLFLFLGPWRKKEPPQVIDLPANSGNSYTQ